jgi:RNA polymerase primary sigma factor
LQVHHQKHKGKYQMMAILSPLDEVRDSLPGETGDMKGRSETGALEELHAHVTTTHRAAGPEDAFQSYLRDIRRFGLLTHTEEIDLARRAAAGDE